MKLWQKISLLTAATLLFSMLFYGAVVIYRTADYNLSQTEDAAAQQVTATAYALSQNLTDAETSGMSETANRAYLQFLLRKYSNKDYMLLQEWELVANTTDYELTGFRLDQFDTEEPVSVIQKNGSRYLMIVGQRIPVSDVQEGRFHLLMIKDISDLYENARTQMGMVLLFLVVIIALAINVIFWMVRRMLKPLRDLQKAAQDFSRGEFKRRVRVRSGDEVGELGRSFNEMAEKIACQMEEIEQESEHRKQLLGALTHEMKTPMTSIIGYSDTLLHVKINETQQKTALSHINRECRRLERLSGKMMDLLELYDNEAIRMEEVPVARLFERVEQIEAYHLQDKGVTLRTDCHSETVCVDEDLIESLLINLIDNAMKASGEGDTIRLSAKGTCITVQDTGKGIPAEEIPRITEAFYMVDKSRSKKAGGLGLGLALCSQIVKLHGARMEIQSELSVGTTITVIFPQKQEERADVS